MEASPLNKVTVEDYLKIEEESQMKYEFHNGFIYAMAGGTLNHGLICGNVFGEIRQKIKELNKSCRPMTSEIKLYVETANSFLYPDAMVTCEEIEKSTSDSNAITNPVIIIEVLSKSTAAYDRSDKFFMYQQLSSLQEYILIEQSKPQIEVYRRASSDLWEINRIQGLDEQLYLKSIDALIALSDIYEDIIFE